MWKYCRTGQKSDKEDPNLWHCLQCEAEGRQDPMITNISTNMRNHLIKVHKIKLLSTASQVELRAIEQLKHLYLKVQAAGTVNEFKAHVFQEHLNLEVVTKALVTLVVVRNLSFSIVKWPKFYTLVKALNPKSSKLIPILHATLVIRVY